MGGYAQPAGNRTATGAPDESSYPSFMQPGVAAQAKSSMPAQPSGTQNFGGGGGGTKKSTPPPPDYYGAASATSQGSQAAANYTTGQNRPNQQTGFGSEQWTQGPDGQWTQNTQLNGPLSGALSGLQGQAANNAQYGPQNSWAAQQQAIGANYNQAASRLNPQWAQQDEQAQNQLINQGLDPNSQAYGQAMTQENQARNDAYSSAMNNAIGMGNQTAQTQMQQQMMPYQQMNALQGYQNGLPGLNAAQGLPGANLPRRGGSGRRLWAPGTGHAELDESAEHEQLPERD